MKSKNIISAIILFGCFVYPTLSNASEFSDKRIKEAALKMKKFMGENRDLRKSEILLYTIDPPLKKNELTSLLSRSEASVSAVHFCPLQGGAVAFFIDPSRSLPSQISMIEQEEYKEFSQSLESLAAGITRGVATGRPTAVEAGTDHGPKQELTFCGFEAKLSREIILQLSRTLRGRIRAVELITPNQRKLPINRND